MSLETAIRKEIENFFEQTCITDYFFKRIDPNELVKIKKKTPVGTWNIESVEIGYFIDVNDNIIIGILDSENDKIFKLVTKLLTEQAKNPEIEKTD